MASPTAASEKRIIGWIEDMIDEPLASSTDLIEAIKDGVALCKLVNKIRAGSVPYINTNPGVLNHLENVSAYLQACWGLGVPTDAMFGTQDLAQKRNIASIIKNIDSLASVTISNDSSGGQSEPSTVVSTTSPSGTKTSQPDTTDDLLADNEELMEENQTLRKRIRKLQESAEEFEAQLADRDKEIQDLNEKLTQALAEVTQLKADAAAANPLPNGTPEEQEKERKTRRLSRLETELATRGKTNAELTAKIQLLEEMNKKLQREIEYMKECSTADGTDASSRSSSRTSLPDVISAVAAAFVPVPPPRDHAAMRERLNSGGSSTIPLPMLPISGGSSTVPAPREALPMLPISGGPLTIPTPRDGLTRRRSTAFSKPPLENNATDPESSPTEPRRRREDSEGSISATSSPNMNRNSFRPPNKPLPVPPSSLDYPSSGSEPPSAETTPVSPRRKRPSTPDITVPNTPQHQPTERPSSTNSEAKRRGFAARIRGVKDKLGKRSERKSDKTDQSHEVRELVKTQGNELPLLIKTIFLTPTAVTFQDVVKINFKKDTTRRLFSLILDQQINSFAPQKSHGLNPHAFDMLLYLVNASLLAMAEDTETDTIALQVLMKSAFFFFKKDRGVVQFIQEHVRSYDIWKRYEFWEEYFYSEVGHHAKEQKDDPKVVYSVTAEFVGRMRDFGVAGGLVQKLINDIAAKDLLTPEDVTTIMKTSTPTPASTPAAASTTVPVMLRHNFTQKSTKRPAWCDYCNEFIWGVNKFVYFCNECKYTIHRKCLDECLPHSACGSKRTFGTPFAVAHNVKVTKNAEGGYDGLPKEWQDLLEQSGIDKKDVLSNPHAVLHILEYHTHQRKRAENEKIMPTPAMSRVQKGTIAPLPPLPPTPRSAAPDHGDELRESSSSVPGDEADEEAEPSVYTIDDIVTREDPTSLYRDITQIGQGANAEVFAGYSIKNGAKVAIKKLKWDPNKSNTLINEIQIMKSSAHCNVIQCTDCFLFKDQLWVIMEYVDYGSLTDILDQYPKGLQLTEAQIAFVLTQTLKALDYIHGQGIIHRDVKTDNILLGMDGRVLLADFGSAARLTSTRPNRKTVIGSPYWMAPELIKGENYSQKVDIFSLGCTLQELASGEPPFSEYPPLKTLFLLATTEVPPLKNDDNKWTALFVDFFNKCVRTDPANRPSASDLLLHPFLGVACKQEEFTEVIKKAISLRDQVLSVFAN
eukprot:Phypoly_transcript_00924.p1 GENE.Phypoly_transcript_00924~~Phypoly_transcript_00924.p1  ORF type:complete len:1210 (+),score=220.50 Phypoly_transcript_00924:130-3759(+)